LVLQGHSNSLQRLVNCKHLLLLLLLPQCFMCLLLLLASLPVGFRMCSSALPLTPAELGRRDTLRQLLRQLLLLLSCTPSLHFVASCGDISLLVPLLLCW
jgi:hypothetical protein